MFVLASISFSAAWVLVGLALLPLIWWLLRLTPPSPRAITFPPIEFVRKVIKHEQTPARTPWWLLVLRLAILVLILLTLSGPHYNPASGLFGTGPVILVIDNGWASAPEWTQRQRLMNDILDEAQRTSRPVVLLTTAAKIQEESWSSDGLMSASHARSMLQTLQPQPWPVDYHATLATLLTITINGTAHTVWISNGLESPGFQELAVTLQRLGRLEILLPPPEILAYLLEPPTMVTNDIQTTIHRAKQGSEAFVTVRLLAADHRILGRVPVRFEPQATTATATLSIPEELHRDMALLEIEEQNSAGATVLLDSRWQRQVIGLVEGCQPASSQPLLNTQHYLEQALIPYATVRKGDLTTLLNSNVSIMILADLAPLQEDQINTLEQWITEGGTVVRFAGPCLANNVDDLVPVPLRIGDRHLGGALSWSQPATLAPFDLNTPFSGLPIPQDVLIYQQVLAQPSLDLETKSWARLVDGTPLVTADHRGSGWLILIHTTATPQWSNLALSGLFVQMLRRIFALGMRTITQTTESLLPLTTLDGFGRLGSVPITALPLDGLTIDQVLIGPRHPPGYYGSEDIRRAVNLGDGIDAPQPLQSLPFGIIVKDFTPSLGLSLVPWLLVGVFLLILGDILVSLALRGHLMQWRTMTRNLQTRMVPMFLVIGLSMIGIGFAMSSPSMADTQHEWQRSLKTYLGYIQTNDAHLDRIANAGLVGLGKVLNQRTSIDIQGVIGVDVETTELTFFPLLYWPISSTQPLLSPAARVRVNHYLRHGGMILFDTRDPHSGSAALRRLTEGIDFPPLQPIPSDHTLTRSFYLLMEFPGRYGGGSLWVARQEGVSSVLIGANDWAAAWAIDNEENPLFAVIPGGEQQREIAYRFGVNLMMYALTGNYKADQVHLPAIMERLGQ